ncbi:MAG TPA: SusD/RagB family nutrient-binding outer membrane lipoprotein, partial [Bacteroidales bacterium]|nr:SusD/RagB family nutrient-binding outer membrane lipoprotein [Bacteroidales bacterium]
PYEFNETSTTTMLESIRRQKWIAATRSQEWEAFLEINRTGYPNYGTVDSRSSSYVVGNLAPSINTVLPAGVFPKRLIYPKTSADYNPNTPVSTIQQPLWWQKQ